MNLQLRYGSQPRIARRWLRETWSTARRALLSARDFAASLVHKTVSSSSFINSRRTAESAWTRGQLTSARFLVASSAWMRETGSAGAAWTRRAGAKSAVKAGRTGRSGLSQASRANVAMGGLILRAVQASGSWLRRTTPDVVIAIDRANLACGRKTVEVSRFLARSSARPVAVGGKAMEAMAKFRYQLLFGPAVATLVIESLLAARLWAQLSGSRMPAWVFETSEPLVAPFARFDSATTEPAAGVFQFSTLLAFEIYLVTFIAIVVLVYTLPTLYFASRRVAKLLTPVPSTAYPRRRTTMRPASKGAITIDRQTIRPVRSETTSVATVPQRENETVSA
jgi:hypothetical protein